MEYIKYFFVISIFSCFLFCDSQVKADTFKCHPVQIGHYEGKSCTLYSDGGRIIRTQQFYLDSAGETQSHGTTKSWHENGKIKSYIKSNFGCPYDTSKGFFPDGSLETITQYKNCEEHGIEKVYYENGQIKHLAYWENGETVGDVKAWYPNGQLKSHHKYEKTYTPDGKQMQWYEDGTIQVEAYWKSGVHQGKKEYWENGQVAIIEKREQGKLIKGKSFNKNGKQIAEVENGSGIMCYYNEEEGEYAIRYYEGGDKIDFRLDKKCKK